MKWILHMKIDMLNGVYEVNDVWLLKLIWWVLRKIYVNVDDLKLL